MTRKVTNEILQMVEDGILDKDAVILACLKYMSEDDVADMAHVNGFIGPDRAESFAQQWWDGEVEDEDAE